MVPEEIPDAWPPVAKDPDAFPIVPMFPLPGVFLFPRQLIQRTQRVGQLHWGEDLRL